MSVPFFSFFIAFFSLSNFFYPLSPPSSLFSTNPARESGKCGRLPHQGLGAAPAASMLLCMSSPKNCNLGHYFGCLFSPGIRSSLFTSPRTCETAPPLFGGATFPRAPFSVSTETGREIVMELSRMGVWCVDGERGAGRRIGREEFRCVPYRCASVPLSSLAICPTGVLVPSPSCRLTIRYSQCRRTRRTSGDFTAKTCSRAYYHLIGTRLSTSSIHYRSQRPTAV